MAAAAAARELGYQRVNFSFQTRSSVILVSFRNGDELAGLAHIRLSHADALESLRAFVQRAPTRPPWSDALLRAINDELEMVVALEAARPWYHQLGLFNDDYSRFKQFAWGSDAWPSGPFDAEC